MRAVDLIAFAESLPREPVKFRRLRGLISAARDAHSAHSDLRLAAEFAARAIDIHHSEESMPRELADDLSLALISSAIIYYARATTSQSRHRRTYDIRSRLDADELKDHNFICGLRDDAIAHYGPGHLTSSVSLREDRMFLAEDGGKIMFATRNLAQSKSLSHILRRQAQRALIITLRSLYDREAEMVEALNEAVAADPALGDETRKHEVDLSKQFGSAEAAAEALRGPRIGSRRIRGFYSPEDQ